MHGNIMLAKDIEVSPSGHFTLKEVFTDVLVRALPSVIHFVALVQIDLDAEDEDSQKDQLTLTILDPDDTPVYQRVRMRSEPSGLAPRRSESIVAAPDVPLSKAGYHTVVCQVANGYPVAGCRLLVLLEP